MPIDQSPNLGLDYIADNQAQKNVTMNEDLGILDTVVQLAVLAADLTTPPPGSPGPEEGDRYIVAGPATGAWAGHDEDVAYYRDGAWQFLTPKIGWLAFNVDGDTALFYGSGGWTSYNDVIISGITALQNLTLLGVNTTADATNVFASLGPGALFTAKTAGAGGTGDLAVTLNKEADGDTLQLVLQKGFSTRALLGLLADNDLTVRVSPDGSAFFTALSIDKDTGNVGVRTTADANNALSVLATACLFTAAVDDLRFTFNKAAAGDDCALSFQTGFSARALVGLLGSDDFTFKVSPDGSAFFTGLAIDKDDGTASLPANPKFSAYTNFENYIASATPTKVQFNVEEADPQSAFNTSTNRFVAPVAGVYTFGFSLLFKKNGANNPTALTAQFYKNGSAAGRGRSGIATPVDGVSTVHATTTLTLAAADYVEVWATFTGTDGYIDDLDSIFWGVLDA